MYMGLMDFENLHEKLVQIEKYRNLLENMLNAFLKTPLHPVSRRHAASGKARWITLAVIMMTTANGMH